jgi:hypothetical protein
MAVIRDGHRHDVILYLELDIRSPAGVRQYVLD